ncbi:GNAT family N-acetyltransferase [Anaerorhabdus sp.]|uniref:GNAT family N-acetyltransferase n=1 Tax=Anaerorhabdus sp. TaxID=1872524 RepID=UPI002FCCAED3
MKLETERLIIRSTTEHDSDFCLSIWLDEKMGKYLSDPPRNQASESYLNFAVDIEKDISWMPFIAIRKDTMELIGTCSLVPNYETCICDLGICVHSCFQHQGYATEIIRALIKYASMFGCLKLTAEVAKENTASNAVFCKLGFHVEKETCFRKANTEIEYDSYIYCLHLK